MADDNGWRTKRPPAPKKSGCYVVGKGKPPKQHQFKPGNKGGGRKPGSRNKTNLDKLLDEKVVVGEDRIGRQIRRSLRDIISRQLVKKAASGDHASIKLVMEFDYKQQQQRALREPLPPTHAGEGEHKKLAEMIDELEALVIDGVQANMACTSDGVRVAQAIKEYRQNHGLPIPELPDEDEWWSLEKA